MPIDKDPPFLRIQRRFDVPPETVFDTLTDPELMPIWWGDDAQFDIDLRVGGKWTIVRREGDEEYLATGSFLEVERPSQLKYTFGMPQFSLNSDTIAISIVADGDGSLMTFDHVGEDIATELADVLPGEISATEIGWQQGFDLMVEAWSKSPGTG